MWFLYLDGSGYMLRHVSVATSADSCEPFAPSHALLPDGRVPGHALLYRDPKDG